MRWLLGTFILLVLGGTGAWFALMQGQGAPAWGDLKMTKVEAGPLTVYVEDVGVLEAVNSVGVVPKNRGELTKLISKG